MNFNSTVLKNSLSVYCAGLDRLLIGARYKPSLPGAARSALGGGGGAPRVALLGKMLLLLPLPSPSPPSPLPKARDTRAWTKLDPVPSQSLNVAPCSLESLKFDLSPQLFVHSSSFTARRSQLRASQRGELDARPETRASRGVRGWLRRRRPPSFESRDLETSDESKAAPCGR